jgi:hypothetical protein
MNEVYIKVKDLNSWIAKYFNRKDIITIEELIGVIEDLDGEVESLNEEIERLKNNDYDPEIEIPDIHGKGISW